jgi:hypothetical protein
MTEMRRSIKITLWVLGISLVLLVAVVYMAVLFVGSVAQSFLNPKGVEFVLSDASCNRVSDTEALVLLQVAPITPGSVMAVRVEDVEVLGGQLSGVATLPAGLEFAGLDEAQRDAMILDLDDDDPFVDVEEDSRVVVLRFVREPDSLVKVESMALWFAYGEPAAQQDVPLAVEWSRTCAASLTDE